MVVSKFSTNSFQFSAAFDCVKSVQIRSFSGPYFSVFSPNTGKYGPKKTSVFRHFSRSKSVI